MTKICLQAGHQGITSGATGAAGEQKWTSEIVPLIAKLLQEKGIETYTCGSLADKDPKVTSTDWDLFLAVHYDADIYNDRGGFVDTADKSVDTSWQQSEKIAAGLRGHYFKVTGIPEKPKRSNGNTKFYYMWSALTAKTPCVIIECGVGNRKPEDFNTLFNQKNKVAESIRDGILIGLGIGVINTGDVDDLNQEIKDLKKELEDLRASRDSWKEKYAELEKRYTEDSRVKQDHIESLQKTTSEQNMQIASMNQQISTLSSERDLALEDRNTLLVDLTRTQGILETKNAEILELTEELKKYKSKGDAILKSFSRSRLIRYILTGK